MTIKKYVYLQGENVVSVLSYDDSDSYQAGMMSAIDDGAIWQEVSHDNPSDQFWTWDGTTATSPNDETWTVS
jgi:hypothetical protein